MTESEIEKLRSRAGEYNGESREQALADFKEGPVPKMKWTMEHILEHLIKSLTLLKAGKCSGYFGSSYQFSLDEIARTLATDTFLDYEGLRFNEEAAAAAPANASFDDVTEPVEIREWTPEFGLWCKIVAALSEYLYTGAVLAKAANPHSSTAYLFLRAWKIVRMIEQNKGNYCSANRQEALTIVRLAAVATKRLWIDIEFAGLPPFKAEPMAKPKENKPANPKAGKSKSRKAKGKKAN